MYWSVWYSIQKDSDPLGLLPHKKNKKEKINGEKRLKKVEYLPQMIGILNMILDKSYSINDSIECVLALHSKLKEDESVDSAALCLIRMMKVNS